MIVRKDLGAATAYGYAVEKGYTGTEEEFAVLMASYADVGQTAVDAALAAKASEDAAKASETASAASQSAAATSAGTASTEAQTATQAANTATTKAGEATTAATTATGKAAEAVQSATQAAASATAAGQSATAAQTAQEAAETAQTKAETAADEAETSSASVAGKTAQIDENTAEISLVKSQITPLIGLPDRVHQLERVVYDKRYGVSGIGQSPSALTRLWDAVGMTAQVGTDGDNSAVINDFDHAAPFMRRKCVGEWNLVNGHAVFTVNAYKGDADYAEDGTMGDYVAVECPLAFYYLQDGVLGVSSYKHPGYRPFDIFCVDHNPDNLMEYYYLPAYALAIKDGKAVSLPGLDNYQGSYQSCLNAARTYDGGTLGTLAVIEPAAVNFYEWALATVEFAVQIHQNVMQGCCNLRHDANTDRVTFVDATHVITNNYMAARVAGEYILICGASDDINAPSRQASHRIVSIIRCDEQGVESATGTHQLLEIEDLGKGYITYDTTGATEYRIGARPYRTGACNGVSTPSGSPVSNSDGYHPMQYRWRENVYGNQYKTIVDLFNKRVGTGDDDWMLEHYYLPRPQDYTPANSNKPDATDLATDAFVKLSVETDHAHYANGYIKSKQYDEDYPDIWVPYETTGASGTTYFGDYAHLVNSPAVRSVRLGGYWTNGAHAGFSFFAGTSAPGSSYAYYGGDLFFIQASGGESAA